MNAINKAIVTCIQSMGWTDLKYSFAAQNLLICHPEKGELPLEAMSDGARSVISMAADIAYRMARLNPDMGEDVTLKTSGVVLIDEVDMHLHPSWQQTVVNDLVKAFPKVQFIVTTHSPQVLTSVPAECIRILHWDNDLVDIEEPTFSLGAESSQLLRDIQHVESRPGSCLSYRHCSAICNWSMRTNGTAKRRWRYAKHWIGGLREENLRWSGRIWISGCVISAGRNKKL